MVGIAWQHVKWTEVTTKHVPKPCPGSLEPHVPSFSVNPQSTGRSDPDEKGSQVSKKNAELTSSYYSDFLHGLNRSFYGEVVYDFSLSHTASCPKEKCTHFESVRSPGTYF